MAYLNSLRTDDRGQLFLIGALALALIFVGLSILLNTAIYTENLASRGTNVVGSSQELVQRDAVQFVGTNMEYVNTNHATYNTYSAKRDSQVEMIAAWTDMNSVGYAQEGRIVRIIAGGANIDRGLRLGQDNIARDFSSANGDNDWLVSADNNRVRDFDLVVDRSALASTGSTGQFTVHLLRTGQYQLTGANKSFEFRIGQSGSNDVDVTVYDDSGTLLETCSTQANATGYTHIELAEGKVGGNDCDALDLAFTTAGVSGYPLYYENADNVAGTWNAYIERGSVYGFIPPAFEPVNPYTNSPGTGSPFQYSAMYATEVTVQVSSEDGVITRTIRVSPGEHQ